MIKSYLSRSELGAQPVGEADLPAHFARFPRDPLLHVLSRVSILLDIHGWDDARAQQLVLDHFASPAARPIIRRFLERDPGSVLLGRQALLASYRLAGAFSSANAADASLVSPHGVLPLLTTVADHLDPWAIRSAADPTERLISRYLFANSLLNDRAAHRDLYVRYFDLYGECWQAAAANHGTEMVSIDDFFRRETGIPMARFFDIAVAITMFVESEARGNPELPASAISRDQLSESTITAEEWAALARHMAMRVDRLEEDSLRAWRRRTWAWDNFLFRDAPLVDLDSSFLVLSLHNLALKVTEGLFWISRTKVTPSEFGRLRGSLGRAFEQYVARVVGRMAPGRSWSGELREGSRTVTEVDAAIVAPPEAVLFEACTRVPPKELLIVADDNRLDQFIDEDIAPKATQLRNAIQFLRDHPTHPLGARKAGDVSAYWPTVVVLGQFPTEPLAIWPRVMRRLEHLGTRTGQLLERLSILSIEDLEDLAGLAASRPPLDLIRQKWADPETRGETMHNYLSTRYQQELNAGYQRVIEARWRLMGERIRRTVFGRGDAAAG
jgi:hypothetical protein